MSIQFICYSWCRCWKMGNLQRHANRHRSRGDIYKVGLKKCRSLNPKPKTLTPKPLNHILTYDMLQTTSFVQSLEMYSWLWSLGELWILHDHRLHLPLLGGTDSLWVAYVWHAFWAVSPDCVGFGHCSMQLSIFCIPTNILTHYIVQAVLLSPKKISKCCVVVVVPLDYNNYRVVRIATLLVDPPLWP